MAVVARWAFLAAFFIPSILAFIYLLRHDRDLVERRLRTGEQVSEQKMLIRLSRPLFLGVLLLPGLDYRLGWSRSWLGAVPDWLAGLALGIVVLALLFVFWVPCVNSYAGRTIVVETGQKVISSGPYAVVRHPMYTDSLVLLLFTPLALGSWVALAAFVPLIPFYVLRLLNEEKVLREELPGYTENCLKTRFLLIPLVW